MVKKKNLLLPCAHCGGAAIYAPAPRDTASASYVVCGGCGISIGLIGDDPRKIWNMRVPNGESSEIERLHTLAQKLAKLAQHSDGCSWCLKLPTGEGYWGCDCGLDSMVLDGELLAPNDKLRGCGDEN